MTLMLQLIYAHNIHLVENQDNNLPSLEDGVEPNGLLNAQTSKVGEEINYDTTKSEHNEEGSESDTDGE